MSKNGFVALVLTVALLLPHSAWAAVRIHEIAWMGNAANANAEWIELFNNGSESVSLSGWTITSAGTAPNITLSGSIGAQGFFLLERTSDASAEPVADQIYTGALANGGDTLTLKDASGAVLDTVVGGTGWQNIGGDNISKKTAQRVGTGWITASPTPRAMNQAHGDTAAATTPEAETPTATSTPVNTIGGSAVPATSPRSPARILFIDPGVDRIVSEDVETPYRAVAYTDKGVVRDARITWSFGDGTRELGESVRHTYDSPGEYLVVARAEHEKAHALKTLRVVVATANVSLTQSDEGILVTNNSDSVLDLSHWKLVGGEEIFTIPEDTALLARGSALFPERVTKLATSTHPALQYPSRKIAVQLKEPEEVKPLAEVHGLPIVKEPIIVTAPKVASKAYDTHIKAPVTPLVASVAGAPYTSPPIQKKPSWFLCLFGSLLACGASFVVP